MRKGLILGICIMLVAVAATGAVYTGAVSYKALYVGTSNALKIDNAGDLATTGAISAASETLATPLPLTSGGTGASTAATAQTDLGLGTMATQNASNVAITGGSATLTTPLPLASGGTGASTIVNARLGLELGSIAVLNSPLSIANGGTGGTTAPLALSALHAQPQQTQKMGAQNETFPDVSNIATYTVNPTSTPGHNITGFTANEYGWGNGPAIGIFVIVGQNSNVNVVPDGVILVMAGNWNAAPGHTLTLAFGYTPGLSSAWYEVCRT